MLGPVFRARHRDTGALVAVKLFRLGLPPERVHRLVSALDRMVVAGLSRSSAVPPAVPHPSIVAPLETGIVDVSAYLVEDLVVGDPLDRATRASADVVLGLAVALAGALDRAADLGVLHGALHPRDVLISGDEVRLTGLGITRALEAVDVQAPIRRPYTAPERAAGGSWDRRADVFALAAIVYDLLWTRRLTGFGRDAVEGLAPISGGVQDLLSGTFARALAEDPAERFETASAFTSALSDALPLAAAAVAERLLRPSAAPVEPLQLPLETPADVDLVHLQPGASESEPDPLRDAVLNATPEDMMRAEAAVPDTARVGWRVRPATPTPNLGDLDMWVNAATADDEPVEAKLADFAPEPSAEAAPIEVPMRAPVADAQVEEDGPSQADIAADIAVPEVEEAAGAFEPSRSAVWPLALALTVGIALGFAGGYGFGIRDRQLAQADGLQSRSAPESPAAPVSGAESSGPALGTAPSAPAQPPATAAPGPARPARESREATDAAPAGPGRILVRSTPGGASVLIDGREVGETPVTFRNLARGIHRLRISRDGYVGEERRITITDRNPAQSVTVSLARARPAPGATAQTPVPQPSAAAAGIAAFVVVSRPDGANVFVDGKLAGKTPIAIPNVVAGDHDVRLELDGYQRWMGTTRVVAGGENKVTASLER